MGRPEAVCWMLLEMRSNLIQFGNCLSLNSQKRQYNIVDWPYIGPVVKDSEMQVHCVAECICLEESHCMYVWIVCMLADMEPRYNLSFFDLIFGDQGLTQKILVDLDIATTCTLRCDYYHQIHEVSMGLGASWSVVEQVSKLLERQKHLTSKRQKKDIQAIVGTRNYK